MINSGYIYALDLKMPRDSSSFGVPGLFQTGVPADIFSEGDINRRREVAYHGSDQEKACLQMRVLLRIDGLIHIDEIPIAELQRPTNHYIGTSSYDIEM